MNALRGYQITWVYGTWFYRNAGSGPLPNREMFWIHPANRALWRRFAYWLLLDVLGIE